MAAAQNSIFNGNLAHSQLSPTNCINLVAALQFWVPTLVSHGPHPS